ncbi:acetyl-CoA carboxylase biotin carboxylase subunit family protein [Mesorhizobium sp. M0130]|uniref:ATP-grasp domain-containing protein n=1 Tax=Mesorhizobium sp. M0130 TaxID=2956887 RepID=UPI0033372537
MPKRALILLEGTRANGLLYVRAAQRLGLNPITLSSDPAQHGYLATESCEASRVDTNNLDALISECSRLRATYEIVGITSAQEAVYATVGELCRHFNLPGPNPESIRRCCDKFIQREILAEGNVPIPAYRLAANAADVKSAAAEIGLPVVLKPAVGINSKGVRLCRDVDEVAEHTTYLLDGKHIWRSPPRILIEEFAQGHHYWIHLMGNEAIGIEGADLGPPPYFLFREAIFPAQLTDDEQKNIEGVSLSCLRALGLGWGPTNIEFRLTKRGPVVIEVNPRLAGHPQPAQLAYGIDLVTEHIKLVIGSEWNLNKRHSYAAGWRSLFPDCDGMLDWIGGVSQAAALSGVAEVKLHVKPETPIFRKGDNIDSLGLITAVSPDVAQTKAILQRAVDLIDWSITPFPTIGE